MRIRNKKALILKLFFVVVLIPLPSYTFAQREAALKETIIEGKSLAGINLGDLESEVFKKLGFPDKIHSNFLTDAPMDMQSLKMLLYGLDEENLLFIYTKNQKVEFLQILWTGEENPEYKGKTMKGVGLGNTVEEVEAKYGRCDISKGACWYKELGILFALGRNKKIGAIQIMAPGTKPPDYVKPKLSLED